MSRFDATIAILAKDKLAVERGTHVNHIFLQVDIFIGSRCLSKLNHSYDTRYHSCSVSVASSAIPEEYNTS